MLTLNQHIQIFRNFASAHSQINSFGFGPDSVLTNTDHGNVGGRLKYPIMMVDAEPISISGNALNRPYRIAFFDKLQKGNKNEIEILSDMQQVAFDLFAYFKNSPPNPKLVVDLSSNPDPKLNVFDDSLGGWDLVITFKEALQYNACTIPYTDVPPALNQSCPKVTIYENDGITVHELVSAGGYFILPASGCSGITITNSNDSFEQEITCEESPYEFPDVTISVYVNGVLNQTTTAPALVDKTININA